MLAWLHSVLHLQPLDKPVTTVPDAHVQIGQPQAASQWRSLGRLATGHDMLCQLTSSAGSLLTRLQAPAAGA